MKIAILGSRGIPNHYGGFEQFASHVSEGLVSQGMEVSVYCTHDHPYQKPDWQGVQLIHIYNPETSLGAFGQFLYDLLCILDARKRHFDVILQLGYTSSSVWHRLLPKGSAIVTNMDGLEWSRIKYSRPVRQFLRYAEKLAVTSSHHLISDSKVIQEYLRETYQAESSFIPYGADILTTPDPSLLEKFQVEKRGYYLVIARIQQDAHLEEILESVNRADTPYPLLVVGKADHYYGKMLQSRFRSNRIRFLGGIFDQQTLNQLRYHCRIYFHGHSSGGTNPSLLEAMAASAPVCAHDNPFNRSVLDMNAAYFQSKEEISAILSSNQKEEFPPEWISKNLDTIRSKYSWDQIIDAYSRLIRTLAHNRV